MEQKFKIIKDILVEQKIDIEDISKDTMLYQEGLCLSSLESIAFFLKIEEVFRVELPPDAYAQIETITDILHFL